MEEREEGTRGGGGERRRGREEHEWMPNVRHSQSTVTRALSSTCRAGVRGWNAWVKAEEGM